jgi:hypothetical protein
MRLTWLFWYRTVGDAIIVLKADGVDVPWWVRMSTWEPKLEKLVKQLLIVPSCEPGWLNEDPMEAMW